MSFDPYNKLHRFEEIAEKVSKLSDYKYKVGAVIFKKGRVVSVGYNQCKTHTKLLKYFEHATIHAECDAILHCPNPGHLDGSSIFVYRTTKDGAPAMAKPCPMCRQLIFENGIKMVYWSTHEFPYWQSAKAVDLFNEVDPVKAYQVNKI